MDRAGRGWRARWARRENARRRRAHEDAVEAWCLHGVRLRRLRAAAEERPEIHAAVPLDLALGETVVAVQPSTGLVTVPRHADLPPPELSAIPLMVPERAPALPDGTRVTDAGTAVLTDRRIVLVGRNSARQWSYAELSGLTHHPGLPLTLLHGPTGALVAGLRVPRGAAPHFRLRLTLAYADATGQRAAVLARLDGAVAANRRTPPPAPVLVSGAHAPGYARLTRPAVTAAAAAVLVAVAALAATTGPDRTRRPPTALPTGGRVTVGPTDDAGIGPAPSGEPTGEPVVPGRPAPTSEASGGVGGGRMLPPRHRAPHPVNPNPGRGPQTGPPSRPAPAPSPAVPSRTPRPSPSATVPPSPSPSPTAKPVDRCGAPENPLGYTYCAGALVHEPAADVCHWFTCVDDFWAGHGYLMRCADGAVGMVGGRYGTCPERSGRKQPVYVSRVRGLPARAGALLVPAADDLL
ncbi:hypothetical protein ACL02O_18955 [Micromonospora sp. MS34]|uniref:hypothetical protein n=1 Tax=Micromonospora sp. MS34 TaxID=3385971 RepID=UPI0039A06805